MAYSLEASIKAKRLTQENWLNHLDSMTDEEIEYMLQKEPDAKRIAEERKAQPGSVRQLAEEMRDFGF